MDRNHLVTRMRALEAAHTLVSRAKVLAFNSRGAYEKLQRVARYLDTESMDSMRAFEADWQAEGLLRRAS